ncbi:MAG: gamma-glutamyltransferase [Acidobacteria bacterium]|nr:gamma-glutamyltransferase [Acidobacteriota bacterium]MBV9475321.1 gamma-glutamyltransferase [Acidobacteriota bacterium]
MKAEGRINKLARFFFILPSAFCILHSAAAYGGGVSNSPHAALSTSSPLATKAGLSILQNGGNAADAAVAIAFVLSAVEPQSQTIGGGGFAVYYDAATRAVWTLDFRETAPLAVTRDAFAKPVNGALAAGVPGTVAGLDALRQKFGTKSWKELLAPAIALSREGLHVDAQLAADIDAAKRDRNLAVLDGASAGKTIAQTELATTLQRLAIRGARDFYEGSLASELIESVHDAGGIIGYRDLRDYKAIWRAPLKLHFGAYDLYTVPPPSGGGVVIGEVLNILANDDLGALGFQTPRMLHLLLEAERRAVIDRDKYLADPLTARIPYRELLSRKRGDAWRKSIDPARAIATAQLTEPSAISAEGEHTTHFTIADAHGNVASVTISLGDDFGGGFVVPRLGFFLNDAMRDFSAKPPNDVAASKRPASSLSPLIVLRDDKPFLALGTRGGSTIPTTILGVFLDVAVFGKSLPDAVEAPRWHQQAAPEELAYERERAPKATVDALNAMGHGVNARDAIGDVHAILFEKGRLVAVADSRRGGAAGGY